MRTAARTRKNGPQHIHGPPKPKSTKVYTHTTRKPRHLLGIAAPIMLSWFVGGGEFGTQKPLGSWTSVYKELPFFVRTVGFFPFHLLVPDQARFHS